MLHVKLPISRINGLLLICWFSLCSLSCNLQTGEPHSSLDWESKNFSPGCLNNIDKTVDDYFNGQPVHTRFNKMFLCVKNALNMFKNHVYGKQKGVFTPNELRQFIHKFIMQDRQINDSLLHQLAILKTIIIGGRIDTLTRADIDQFIIFLKAVKEEALFLQPHVQAIYNLNNPMYIAKNNRRVTADFIKSIDRMSVFLNKFARSYSFSNMQTMIQQLDLFLNSNIKITNLDQKIKTIKKTYQFITNTSTDVIQPDEWRKFLLSSSYLVAAGMHYLYLQKQSNWLTLKSTHSIQLILSNLIQFLSESTRSYPQQTIKEKDLMQLALYFQSLDIIPKYFSQTSLHNMLSILFGKIFNTNKKQYGVIQVSLSQIEQMYLTTQSWIQLQSLLNKTIRVHSLTLNHPITIPMIEQVRSDNTLLKKVSNKNLAAFDISENLKQIFALKPLHKVGWTVDLSRSIYLPAKYKNYNYRILTVHHFYKTLTRMIKNGYQKKYSATQGITQPELVDFLTDLNPIATDMGWFQQTEDELFNIGEAEFILANTVTPSTPGFNIDWQQPEYLTEEEMIEYLAYNLSIYSSLKEIEPILSQKCTHIINNQYNIQCVSENLIPILSTHMPNMPGLLEKFSTMNPDQKQSFTQALIHIAFDTQSAYDSAKYLTRWHIKNMLTSLYFVETVINRFDTNSDSILQHEEIWKAFPVFHGYLNRSVAITLQWPEGLEFASDLYAYVIANKSLPYQTTNSWEDQLVVNLDIWWQLKTHSIWQQHKEYRSWFSYLPSIDWTLEMDHEHLIRVFSAVIKGFVEEKYERIQTTEETSTATSTNNLPTKMPSPQKPSVTKPHIPSELEKRIPR